MASTFTDIGTELMTTGENAGNWGTKTNTNLQIIEEALRGYVSQSIAGGVQTTALTYSDGSTGDTARNMVIALTGSITGNQTVTVTAKEKLWVIDNQTSGAYTVNIKVSGQTGVTWAATDKGTKILYCNGTDVIDTGISSTGAFDLDGNEFILDADADTSITADTDDQIDIKIAGTDQITIKDGALSPVTTNDIDLGTASLEFKDAFFDGTVTADAFAGPLTTAAQTNITSLGTLTALTVDDVAVNGKVVTMTGSASDTAVLTAGTNGTLSIVTTDDAAAAANIQITADGTVDIDSAGILTLDSGAAINIEPAAGSAILLDGTISVDAGVVTGATSITSTAFVGALTGNVTGNASGTAATVTTAAQSNITSLGTLTTLTVDNVITNGATIGHTSDIDLITLADGAVTVAGTIGSGAITSTGIVTGTAFTAGSAVLAEAELELLDGLTAGTAIASKVVTTDSSIDTTGQRNLTISGELDAATLDISSSIDIAGASQFSGAVTVGVDDTGLDVKFFGASAGAYLEWDESVDQLRIMGASADATTSTGKLLLATSLTDINANDILGKIDFQAPHEAGGTDAITVAASIQAMAQGTFSSSVNATDLIFYTGHSEAATEKFRFTSQGELGVGGANYGSDGHVLTSTGAGTAPAWEAVPGASALAADDLTAGDAAVSLATSSGNVTVDSNAGAVSIDGHTGVTLASSNSGDITLDSVADINLDAAGNDFLFKAGGTHVLSITNSSSDVIIKPIVDAKDIIFQQRDGTEVARIEDAGTLNVVTGKLAINATAVTSTAAELNILDDVTATTAELNYSDLATLGTSAASKVLSADANNLSKITGAIYIEEATLSFDATQDWDVRASPVAKVTLTANVTFDAPSNPTTGQFISIVCIQDGTGSRTIAWNAVFEFASDTAPTATTTANLGDMFNFRYNGAKWLEVGRNLALTLS